MKTVTFSTSGVHCPSCTKMIEMTVDELDGVVSSSADHTTKMATVQYDPEKILPKAIAEAIIAAGYGAEITE